MVKWRAFYFWRQTDQDVAMSIIRCVIFSKLPTTSEFHRLYYNGNRLLHSKELFGF